jgi:hypothetical protein
MYSAPPQAVGGPPPIAEDEDKDDGEHEHGDVTTTTKKCSSTAKFRMIAWHVRDSDVQVSRNEPNPHECESKFAILASLSKNVIVSSGC